MGRKQENPIIKLKLVYDPVAAARKRCDVGT